MSHIQLPAPVLLMAFANERSEKGFLRQLTTEMKHLLQVTEKAVQKNQCHVRVIPAASQGEIAAFFQDAWYEGRIWAFHYAGHADEDELWLENEQGGNKSFFSLGLARFLGAQKGLKLVFLNACATGEHARLLLDANIPVVIATSRKIPDDQATRFSTVFYQGLANGASIEDAFQEAEGMLLGEFGPEHFRQESLTRGLYWEDAPETAPENQLPWKMFLRPDIVMPARVTLFESQAQHDEPAENEDFTGQTLGNYKLLEQLGQGSIGNVYRALHINLNEERALKITHPVTDGYEILRSILIAGNKGLGSLRHPNIVNFYDVGEALVGGSRRMYIVMELVKGRRLDELNLAGMMEKKEDIEYLIDICLQIATGLEAAHHTRYEDEAGSAREGIIHGNIKTRKIMFTPDGVPKLIDFLFTDMTRAHNVRMEVPESIRQRARTERLEAFFPPEVIRGESPVNKQTDIYALGAVMFEMATGQSIANLSFTTENNLHDFLTQHHRLIPRHLSRSIFHATHPDPRQRYQSVSELIQVLMAGNSLMKQAQYWLRRSRQRLTARLRRV
ncbi:MAG: protein kinase [Bacteroidia bacterium]|nr:protein kinase [Bacteroidia bacterium]